MLDRVEFRISGGLADYRSVLSHFAVLIPHDAAVPGALTAGDLSDLASALAPRPLHLASMVDHMNRPVAAASLRTEYAPALRSYASQPPALTLAEHSSPAAAWILQQLK